MMTVPYQGAIDQAVNFYNRERVYKPKVVQASLFFRDENFGLDDISFDLLIDESHSIEFDVADHAVENGATISDHVQERLRKVSVTGLFTNHPIGEKRSGYVNEDDSVNREADSVSINGQPMKDNRSRDFKLDQLKKLARERKPVRLVTSLEVYEKMVVEELSYDRGPDDGESIKFTVKLREVRTAEVKTTYREGVKPVPAPTTQDTDEGKKMAENEKEGKVTGVELGSERMKTAITGQLIGV